MGPGTSVVQVVSGDLTAPLSFAKICDGVSTVVASATAIGRRLVNRHGPSIREVDEAGMAALVRTAEQAGVERFVYVSFAGADSSFGSPLEHAKLATEQRLKESSMRRVVVRPDAFQEIHLGPLGRFDLRNGKVAVFGKGNTRKRWVGTDDVAALIADGRRRAGASGDARVRRTGGAEPERGDRGRRAGDRPAHAAAAVAVARRTARYARAGPAERRHGVDLRHQFIQQQARSLS